MKYFDNHLNNFSNQQLKKTKHSSKIRKLKQAKFKLQKWVNFFVLLDKDIFRRHLNLSIKVAFSTVFPTFYFFNTDIASQKSHIHYVCT